MRKKILTKLVGVLLSVDDYLRLVEATNKFEISISEYIRKINY